MSCEKLDNLFLHINVSCGLLKKEKKAFYGNKLYNKIACIISTLEFVKVKGRTSLSTARNVQFFLEGLCRTHILVPCIPYNQNRENKNKMQENKKSYPAILHPFFQLHPALPQII